MKLDSKTEEANPEEEEPDMKGDRWNFLLLVCMYVLQYVPRGLITAIPLILQNRKATYANQVRFLLSRHLVVTHTGPRYD